VFILSAERDGPEPHAQECFQRYAEYLEANKHRFPPGAHALATSSWFHGFSDHRAPHDAWLDAVTIEEPASGDRREVRTVAIRIRLLGAYHDGHIELVYPRVFRYQLALDRGEQGHCDWRYDEFRLSEGGHMIHEIEWAGMDDTGRWVIEASDVDYQWHPLPSEHQVPAV
jgi:hypothetical protein